MNQEQSRFVENEIWTLTFGAAFQRASVYNNPVLDRDKNIFKKKLRKFIEDELLPIYRETVCSSNEDHLKNIQRISDFSTNFGQILNNGRLNFGVSQKLLNLILKYKWCLFDYPEPPHFPVDRRIQENLNFQTIIPWTRITNQSAYMKIINEVIVLAGDESLAQFELRHFERRRDSN
jgi:hypothetical protein